MLHVGSLTFNCGRRRSRRDLDEAAKEVLPASHLLYFGLLRAVAEEAEPPSPLRRHLEHADTVSVSALGISININDPKVLI